jgi:DNA-binding MarR family transcriptional regulator
MSPPGRLRRPVNRRPVYDDAMQRRQQRRSASALPGLDIAEQKSWQNYLNATLRSHTAMNLQLTGEHQLRLVDLRVLNIIASASGGSVRMGDLADAVESMPARVTNRVRRLEERGLVRREVFPGDRRGVMAVITEEGRAMVAKATATYERGVRTHVLGALSRTQMTAIETNCRRINSAQKPSRSTA